MKNYLKHLLGICIILTASCSAQKNLENNNDFSQYKIKGLPFWQIKKELQLEDYTFSQIKRSWTKNKSSSTQIGIQNIDGAFSKTTSENTISFNVKKDSLTSQVALSNEYTQKDISFMERFIEFSTTSKQNMYGSITLSNSKLAKYYVANEFRKLKMHYDGLLFFDETFYQIETNQTTFEGTIFSITKNNALLCSASTLGKLEMKTQIESELKLIFTSTLTSLIFNHLNNQQ